MYITLDQSVICERGQMAKIIPHVNTDILAA
jgi:hypothetical protein